MKTQSAQSTKAHQNQAQSQSTLVSAQANAGQLLQKPLMPEIEVSFAREKELYSIVVLTRKYFPYAGFNFQELQKRLHEKGVIYFCARANNHAIGYIDFKVNRQSIKILGLAVIEEFRRQKAASKLLKKTLDWAVQHKKKNAFLFVDAENLAAQKLYANHGFSSKGTLGRQIAGKTILLLYKDLEAKKQGKKRRALPAISIASTPRRDVA